MTTSQKRIAIGAGIAVLLLLLVFYFNSADADEGQLLTKAQQGDFVVSVTTSGELEAENSVNIQGPRSMQAAGIWQTKIHKLVPEGTLVKADGFVAELDRSELRQKKEAAENELTKAQAQYETVMLDTTLQLRELRDQLVNQDFALQEKRLVLEQSAYEPPATVKQAEIAVLQAERQLAQAKKSYKLKVQQAKARMREAYATLQTQRNKADMLSDLEKDFVITAPKPGMVIYERNWNGEKKREGSQVSAWNPTVAILPDMSSMISKTYVNEVDIRKIKKGQQVQVGLDAFPEKQISGEVISVANVGEELPKIDGKVFEVKVLLAETDSILRPAMTTSNIIQAEVVPNAVFVPLEAVFTSDDQTNYVYLKDGLSTVKQQVVTGKTNDNFVVIENGIAPGQMLSLVQVAGMEEAEIQALADAPTITQK